MNAKFLQRIIVILIVTVVISGCAQATPPSTPTSISTSTSTSVPSTPTQPPPTKTQIPPTSTPKPLELIGGIDTWALITIEFRDYIETASQSFYPERNGQFLPDWQYLVLEFECPPTNKSLISAYLGKDMTGVGEMYKADGFSDVYVTDSKEGKYPTVVIGECRLAFPLPKASKGFTLHFKDFEPLGLGL